MPVSILHVCLDASILWSLVCCLPRTRAVTADPSSRTHMPSQPVSHSNSLSPAISAPMAHRREIGTEMRLVFSSAGTPLCRFPPTFKRV